MYYFPLLSITPPILVCVLIPGSPDGSLMTHAGLVRGSPLPANRRLLLAQCIGMRVAH